MSIPNFLSIHIGKLRLGVIKGGMGIRWFDKPRKNHQFDTQATRPLPNIDAKVRLNHLYLPNESYLIEKSNLETPRKPSISKPVGQAWIFSYLIA